MRSVRVRLSGILFFANGNNTKIVQHLCALRPKLRNISQDVHGAVSFSSGNVAVRCCHMSR